MPDPKGLESLFFTDKNIDPVHRIYVNRDLNLASIGAIGFDMDHTLAVYERKSIEEVAFSLAKTKLIEERAYPIENVRYNPDIAVRGLVLDIERGNLLKLDIHNYVTQALHGEALLERAIRKTLYTNERIELQGGHEEVQPARYQSVDSLFELPKVCLYMQVILELESRREQFSYVKVFEDVKWAINTVHRDGTLKTRILAELSRYFVTVPDLSTTLDRFRKSGRKLFLLTNSYIDYADAVMSHILKPDVPGYGSWLDFFDVIATGAKKPGFFSRLDHLTPVEAQGEVAFPQNKVFVHGNYKDLEKRLGVSGDRILYLGDDIFMDVLIGKKDGFWRTALILEELESELRVAAQNREENAELDAHYLEIVRLTAESDQLRDSCSDLRRQKFEDYLQKKIEDLPEYDRHIAENYERIEQLNGLVTERLTRIAELEKACHDRFNHYWGSIFRAERANSRFFAQVKKFACVYTSRVVNFLNYPMNKYFAAHRELMSHEYR